MTIKAAPGREGVLGRDGVMGIVDDLRRLRGDVKRAVIRGKPTRDDPYEKIDLIEDRISADPEIKLGRGRRYSRQDRFEALSQTLHEWLKLWRAENGAGGRTMTALHFERWWPYLASAAILCFWIWLGMPFPSKPDPLMGASGTVAAVLVGFLGTAKAIVLTVTRSAVFQAIKTNRL